MLLVAKQLGTDTEAAAIQHQLVDALGTWFAADDPRPNRFIYYDTTIKGVVGGEPSFGSDEFNDHHFHYGYFIYAAAVVAKYDESFADTHGAFLDALVADITHPEQAENGPKYRRSISTLVIAGP